MRTLPRLLAACTAIAMLAVDPTDARAQTTVPVADAQAFLGAWALAIDAQGQTFTMDLNIQDVDGSVAADVSSEMGGPQAVTDISKAGENLVLSYTAEAQGQRFPIEITLAPAGAELNAELDFADGMFTANGKGTKK